MNAEVSEFLGSIRDRSIFRFPEPHSACAHLYCPTKKDRPTNTFAALNLRFNLMLLKCGVDHVKVYYPLKKNTFALLIATIERIIISFEKNKRGVIYFSEDNKITTLACLT